MKAISKRLVKLESRFGAVETEFTRNLRQRLEHARLRAGLPVRSPEDLSGMTVEQILNRGRLRARQGAAQSSDNVDYRGMQVPF